MQHTREPLPIYARQHMQNILIHVQVMISVNSRHIPAFTVVGKNLAALCSTCFSVFFPAPGSPSRRLAHSLPWPARLLACSSSSAHSQPSPRPPPRPATASPRGGGRRRGSQPGRRPVGSRREEEKRVPREEDRCGSGRPASRRRSCSSSGGPATRSGPSRPPPLAHSPASSI